MKLLFTRKIPAFAAGLVLASAFWAHAQAPFTLGSVEGFDNLPLGAIENGQTAYGTFSSPAGNSEISTIKSISSPYCLHLKGAGDGKTNQAAITFPSATEDKTILSFKAERFTSAAPFAFRVYAVNEHNQETEIINGDSVATGTFPNTLKGILPAGTAGIVFKIEAYPDKGVLIENLVIDYMKCSVAAEAWPAMIRKECNGICRISLDGFENIDKAVFTIDMSPTDRLDDIESVCIQTGNENNVYIFDGYGAGEHVTTYAAPKFSDDQKPSERMTFRMKEGFVHNSRAPYFWVSVKLKPTASLDRKVGCKLVNVQINEETFVPESDITAKQRIGFAVAKTGDKVYGKPSPRGKESKKFRIPGIVKAKNGDLVAVFDARYDNRKDMSSNIHVAVSRSTDGGQTWSPINIAMNYTGCKGNPVPSGNVNYSASYGVGDPSILVDETTGTLWVTALARFGLSASGAGFTDNTTAQFAIAHSTDNGLTWSELSSLNFQCKDQEWSTFFQGPGHGITMKDNGDGIRRLVFPAQIWKRGTSFARSCIIYSENHGLTWKCEEQGKSESEIGIGSRTSEASVVQLKDGSLMLNARNEAARGYRIVYTTKDLGKTWSAHSTNNKGLAEPTCQASILAVENTGNVERMLLFSNPAVSNTPRRQMTLKASFDEGSTWPSQNQVLYDSRPSCGYSDICMADEEHVGVLYEALDADEDLFFLKIHVDEILPQLNVLSGADSGIPAEETEDEAELTEIAQFTPSRASSPPAAAIDDAGSDEETDEAEIGQFSTTSGASPAEQEEEQASAGELPDEDSEETPLDDSPCEEVATEDTSSTPADEAALPQSTEAIAETMVKEDEAAEKLLGNTRPAFELAPNSAATTEWVTVVSNSSWTLSSNVPWVQIHPGFGKGTQKVKLTVYENDRPVARTGILTLRTKGRVPLRIRVKQESN